MNLLFVIIIVLVFGIFLLLDENNRLKKEKIEYEEFLKNAKVIYNKKKNIKE